MDNPDPTVKERFKAQGKHLAAELLWVALIVGVAAIVIVVLLYVNR